MLVSFRHEGVLGKSLLLLALALLALAVWYWLPERDFPCVVEKTMSVYNKSYKTAQ